MSLSSHRTRSKPSRTAVSARMFRPSYTSEPWEKVHWTSPESCRPTQDRQKSVLSISIAGTAISVLMRFRPPQIIRS